MKAHSLTIYAFLIALFASPSPVQAQGRRPFLTLEESVRATPSARRERLGIRPLDLSDPLDRAIQKEMDNLNWGYEFLGYKKKAKVAWTETEGSSADPVDGVLLNRRQVQKLVDRIQREFDTSTANEIAYLAAIAHERAHCFQFELYGVKKAFEYPTIVMEAQADIIAGTWFGNQVVTDMIRQSTLNPNSTDPRFIAEYQKKLTSYARAIELAATLLGEHSGDSHPSSRQRSDLFAQGFLLTFASHFLQPSFAGTPIASQADTMLKQIDFHYGKEKMAEWSLRRAYDQVGLSPDEETSSLVTAVLKIAAAAPDFKAVRGLRKGSLDDDTTYFESTIPVPGASSATVFIDKGGLNFVSLTFFSGSDEEEAHKIFEKLRDQLSEDLPSVWRRSNPGANRSFVDHTRWSKADSAADLSLQLVEFRGRWRVDLHILRA